MRPHYFDFTAYRWRGIYPPKGQRSPCRMMAELLSAAMSMVRLWLRRRDERHALAAFDRQMLRDIGVTPSEAAREISKPFWRA